VGRAVCLKVVIKKLGSNLQELMEDLFPQNNHPSSETMAESSSSEFSIWIHHVHTTNSLMAASLWQSTGKREKERKREYFCGTDKLKIEEHTQNVGYVREWPII
jgi:hypothetical protein